MRLLSRVLGAAALLVGAAVPLGLTPTAAHAATACSPRGVTVVVDPGALGGGVRQSCGGGAGTAAALLGAGHTLTRVQSQPGAVCSVDHVPDQTCPQMPPANRYWALFWTDGTSSHWTYASLGVDALHVPAGGSVALAWQSAAGNRAPAFVAPVTKAAAPAAKPTRKPTSKPTRKSSPSPTARPSARASAAASSTPPPTATSTLPTPTPASGAPGRHHRSRATVTGRASTAPSTVLSAPSGPSAGTASGAVPAAPTSSADSAAGSSSTGTVDDAAPTAGGGLPGWVAPAAVVIVLAAGGGVVARRRLRG